MNRDEIVKLAKECTAPEWWDEGMDRYHMGMDFIAFAAAIRAATKEEDAGICDLEASKLGQTKEALVAGICAATIRASK